MVNTHVGGMDIARSCSFSRGTNYEYTACDVNGDGS